MTHYRFSGLKTTVVCQNVTDEKDYPEANNDQMTFQEQNTDLM